MKKKVSNWWYGLGMQRAMCVLYAAICVVLVAAIAVLCMITFSAEEAQAAEFADVSEYEASEEDALYIAQTIYGEAGSDYISTAEKAMVAWTILNRLDSGRYGDSVYAVCAAPGQFYGFRAGSTPPEHILEIAQDVLRRHAAEQAGESNVGRVLPPEYYYFYGDGAHNYFNNGGSGAYDFSSEGYPSPY